MKCQGINYRMLNGVSCRLKSFRAASPPGAGSNFSGIVRYIMAVNKTCLRENLPMGRMPETYHDRLSTRGFESSWGASTGLVRLATMYSAVELLLRVRIVAMAAAAQGYTNSRLR